MAGDLATPPIRSQVVDQGGRLSQPWVAWFVTLYRRVGEAIGRSTVEIDADVATLLRDAAGLDDRVDSLEESRTADEARITALEDDLGGYEGTIDHTHIQNIGTHTHAQIDTFMALATATPTPGALAKADASGRLNDWVDMPQFDDFWEIDADGHLVPSQNPTTSSWWELDADGHIVPKAV